jgi:NAD(P)-dependent dehydrogenase (short-subunit alcohol dehydrogenase family)
MKRVVVVGASSGLGRSIGIGLAGQGARVALLARRRDRLEKAAGEAGTDAVPIVCDVMDQASCREAVAEAAAALGGIDGLVYAAGVLACTPIEQTDAATWARLFATNVTGAALVTAAALPHLTRAQGAAVYLSSISASIGPPWPLIGAYATSKAALDKLVEVWQNEHPNVGFTRLTLGDCIGGDGDSATEMIAGVDPEMVGRAVSEWVRLGYYTGHFIDIDHLIDILASVLRCGKSSVLPSVALIPRVAAAAVPSED